MTVGSPLMLAIVSVADLEKSLSYYVGHLGLEPAMECEWSDPALACGLLPSGESARIRRVARPGSDVGQILLVEYTAGSGQQIRQFDERRFYGLFNLNFYCEDIESAADEAEALGHVLWSRPVNYEMSVRAGRPTEVLYDGPDGVPINLVQPPTDGQTAAGRAGRFFAETPRTRTGFTEVVTSSHCVKDREPLFEFHRRVLGQEPVIDEVLASVETDELLGLQAGNETRVTFMKHPSHWYGKVVLSHPVNYVPPDLVPRALAGNLGYLAMGFDVSDLAGALDAGRKLGATVLVDPQPTELGHGRKELCALMTAPGSGASYLLRQRR